MLLQTATQSPFEWVNSHLALIGWPAIVYVTYRLTRFLSMVETRLLEFEKTFEKATTNDLPHIQSAVESMNLSIQGLRQILLGMRQDLQVYVYRTLPSHLDDGLNDN